MNHPIKFVDRDNKGKLVPASFLRLRLTQKALQLQV